MTGYRFSIAALCLGFCLLPATAGADEISLEGEVAFVSDHSFRGISRTQGDPAGQAILDLVHDNGLYAGVFVSYFDDLFGRDIETEFYLGYAGTSGAYDFNFTVAHDSFHGGGSSTGYFEIRGTVSRDFGLAYVSGGLAVSPDNREFGGGRSVYAFTGAEVPLPFPNLPPMSVDMKIGYEDFAGGFDKWDWSIGYFVDYKGLEWGIQYKDTNLKGFPNAGAKALFTLRKYF